MMRLFGRGRHRAPPFVPSVPPGTRVYAIGDVHGRLDLLLELFALIAMDNRARPPAETQLVLLGDLIDRGPQSAAVVDLLRGRPPAFADTMHLLMGNHEEMLLKLLDEPSAEMLAHFLRFGGYATLESYGVPERMLELPELYAPEALLDAVPEAHRAFFRAMADMVRIGDYLFVHAGIRPDVPLAEQAASDLRWIRGPFLTSKADHGVTVVHGHTISDTAELKGNRIGIDTGAYATGVLTAVGLEGTDQWLIATLG